MTLSRNDDRPYIMLPYVLPIFQAIYALCLVLYYIVEGTLLAVIPSEWIRHPKSLKNEVCLVTGAGNGLGRLVALKLGAMGARVVCVDIDDNANKNTRDLIETSGGQAWAFTCNVAVRSEVSTMAGKIFDSIGRVTVLINNAGVMHPAKKIHELSPESIVRTIDINLLSHFWTVREFLPEMMNINHGHIVTIASVASYTGSDRLSAYTSSKAALLNFNESLEWELREQGRFGVKTSIICPYQLDTAMFDGFKSKFDWFLSPLKTGMVANKIIDAIVYEKGHVLIPWYLNMLMIAKTVFPQKATFAAFEYLGALEQASELRVDEEYKAKPIDDVN